MGGGTSLWASPEWKNDPREIFNGKLLLLGVTVAMAGCSKAMGFDDLEPSEVDQREGNIAAMLAAGGSAGALLAAPCANFLGWKKSVTLMSGLFLIGFSMQEVPNLNVLYVGRLFAGIAIGATSMYLAENSPKTIRGTLTTSYNLMIVLALCLAFWVNYAVSLWPELNPNDNKSWQLALGVQLIPGFFLFCLIWFVIETPRALISKGKKERGLKNLCKLRGLPADHPYVHQEYMKINTQAEFEQSQYKGYNYIAVFKDIGKNPSNRRRFFLANMLFLFHKLTGTDSLNYFAPEIFAMIGVPRGSSALLTVGIYGLVKLVATIIYVTLSLLTESAVVSLFSLDIPHAVAGPSATASRHAWLLPEIFYARIRSVCMAFCLFTNWIVNHGITSATPHMMRTMGYGTFLFFSIMTFICVGFIYVCLPELKGRSMESMDDLFLHSLWSMFKRAYPAPDELVRHDVQEQLAREDHKNDGTNVSMLEEQDVGKRI
ncbi:hypothetical protein ACHAQH_008219 [Verticillium albo-atrum]